jgi:hypothetical protein
VRTPNARAGETYTIKAVYDTQGYQDGLVAETQYTVK